MQKIPRLSTEQRTNLVAYLDGELPEGDVRDIDQVLSKSPAVRHDVEMLSRTWDLLDQLPRLASGEDFTARTLAIAKQEEAPQSFQPALWLQRLPLERLRRGGLLVAWLAVLGASSFAGYAITSRLIPDQSEELLRDLPVIEKFSQYSNVESLEFLKELDKRIGSFNVPSRAKK